MFFCLFISKINAQTSYFLDNTLNGQSINTCAGIFISSWDGVYSGYPGYANNENYTVTFCSGEPGKSFGISFLPLYLLGYPTDATLFVETNYDFLTIYDGPNTSSPVLANLTGILYNLFSYSSTGECLTIRFRSDNTINGIGWFALLGCEPDSCNNNPPASDICSTAPQICNLDGYCGNTSGWYTPDNMTTLGGDYGGNFCGSIENNSWVKFVAGSTTASFQFTSSNCEDPSSGIQAIIYQSTNCNTFTPVSNCFSQASGSGTFTITTNVPLTIGQTYYIMIDGYAGNACDYVVNASFGIQTYTVSGPPGNRICKGSSTTLTVNGAPGGATFQWSPASAIIGSTTGQSVNVNPDVTTDFTVIVNSTICNIDTLYYTLDVEKPTAVAGNSGPFCSGQNISLTSSGGATYAWTGPGGFTSNSQNPTRPNATAAMAGTYTVIVIDANGCRDTTSTTVVIDPLPVINVSPTGPLEICPPATTSISFNTSGFSNIQWYSGAGALSGQNAGSLTIFSAGNYYVTAMDANGCSGTSNQVTVNNTAIITPTFTAISPICNGDPAPVLPVTSNNGITGAWSPTPVSNSTSGTYTFTPDVGLCASTTTMNVAVNLPVTPSFVPFLDLCEGDAAPVLPGSSIEGISGSWNPSTVNNMTTNDYLFTPSSGQCAIQTTITIQVNDLPITTPVYHD
jgi:hypothetical protein